MAIIHSRKCLNQLLSLRNLNTKSSYLDRRKLLMNKNSIVVYQICDNFSTNNNSKITKIDPNTQISKDVKIGERIKQTTKDGMNISVILVGVGIFGFVIYSIFKEFFSSKSPTSIFTAALKKCKNDPRVTELLGEPIKGHGELTKRGRARHVSSIEYEKNGRTYIRVRFYLKGSFNTATVECETVKDSPSSHFRYLFVQTDTYPSQTIIIEDNRLLDDQQ